MHRPTRKSNILDLIFCPNELINSIVVSDTSMQKRTKLRKMSSTKSITQLIKIEQAICDSHLKEKLNEAKIKSDPIFFFRYAKKIVSVRVILGLSKTHTHNYWLMKGLRYVPYY